MLCLSRPLNQYAVTYRVCCAAGHALKHKAGYVQGRETSWVYLYQQRCMVIYHNLHAIACCRLPYNLMSPYPFQGPLLLPCCLHQGCYSTQLVCLLAPVLSKAVLNQQAANPGWGQTHPHVSADASALIAAPML